MSDYYYLMQSTEPKHIGVKNGICQAEIYKDGFDSSEMYNHLMERLGSREYWKYKNEIWDCDFEVQCVKLLKSAVLTDALLFSPKMMCVDFLVSKRLKQILESFNLSEHKFHKATLYGNGTEYEYFMPYMEPIEKKHVNFSKSTFALWNGLFDKKTLQFASENELDDYLEDEPLLKYEEVYLAEGFDNSLDYFKFFNGRVVVSKRLKDKIEKIGVTGLYFVSTLKGGKMFPIIHST